MRWNHGVVKPKFCLSGKVCWDTRMRYNYLQIKQPVYSNIFVISFIFDYTSIRPSLWYALICNIIILLLNMQYMWVFSYSRFDLNWSTVNNIHTIWTWCIRIVCLHFSYSSNFNDYVITKLRSICSLNSYKIYLKCVCVWRESCVLISWWTWYTFWNMFCCGQWRFVYNK